MEAPTKTREADLSDLLSRIESADGPCRDLSAAVHDWLFPRRAEVVEVPGREPVTLPAGWGRGMLDPAYTHSMDDTLRMVEARIPERHPGWTWNMKAVYGSGHGPYFWAEITWPSHECPGRGRTPALAMLAAGLRGIRDSAA